MTTDSKVGDIQVDHDKSEWVVVAVAGRNRVSRVKRNSLAHYLHAEVSSEIASSYQAEKVEN
jgi:hypothetical protein